MRLMIAVLQHLPFIKQLLHIERLQILAAPAGDQSDLLLRSTVFRHACKTPLAVLLTSLSMITEMPAKSPAPMLRSENFQPAELGMSATKQLIQLFNELEHGSHANEQFSIEAALREVITLLNRGHLHYISYLDARATLQGNRLYFQEAVACIISNAQEAYVTGDRRQVVVVLARPLTIDRASIEVIDSGGGMTPLAQRLAMLEGVSYKTTGTGLGLSFTRHVVTHMLHGAVALESQVGIGTRVKLELPLVHQSGSQNPERS